MKDCFRKTAAYLSEHVNPDAERFLRVILARGQNWQSHVKNLDGFRFVHSITSINLVANYWVAPSIVKNICQYVWLHYGFTRFE